MLHKFLQGVIASVALAAVLAGPQAQAATGDILNHKSARSFVVYWPQRHLSGLR